jgi:hypothetical protein
MRRTWGVCQNPTTPTRTWEGLVTKKTVSIAAAAAVTLTPLALAAPSQAAVVAPAKTLYACQKKNNGALRIVKKSKKCKKSEKKINWNTQGPQGAKGDKGDIGTPGTPGPGATPWSMNLSTPNLVAGGNSADVATVGDMTLNFNCGVFVGLLGTSPRITSPTAGTYTTRGVWLNSPDQNGGGNINEMELRDFTQGNIAATVQKTVSSEGTQVSALGVPPLYKNFGYYQIELTNASGTYLVNYSASITATVPAPEGPKGFCAAVGWWSKLS